MSYDQSFSKPSLSNVIRKSDYRKLGVLYDINKKNEILEGSAKEAEESFHSLDFLRTTEIKNKKVFSPKSFESEMILRKINQNIKALLNHSPQSRDYIISNLRCLLEEGVTYRVYRLDIANFYESFSHETALEHLYKQKTLSTPTIRHIKNIFQGMALNNFQGLPRGLSLSGTIADLIMKEFDNVINSQSNVFFYARYVDDILIVTSKDENKRSFIQSITKALPEGLKLNPEKQSIQETNAISPHPKNTKTPLPSIIDLEFLGYRFQVYDPVKSNEKNPSRIVKLDIAKSKVKKIKTRIALSMVDYCKNKDFPLLESRILFLTSNFSVFDIDRERKRLAGIHFNYHLIDHNSSKALQELDTYLIAAITSGQGKLSNRFFINTSDKQRRALCTKSFTRGFTCKTFINYSSKSLKKIQKCWKYV